MATQDGEQTYYEAIGGAETIERVVHRFYQGVRSDPLLRAIYPEEDLAPAEDRFTKFLIQYWGGPTTYSQERGHPRLRMRHAPFAVTAEAREHWLTHFRAGLDDVALPPELDATFWDYVERASLMMVNTHEDEPQALRLQDRETPGPARAP